MVALADFLHQAYETANALNQVIVQRQRAAEGAPGGQGACAGQEGCGT